MDKITKELRSQGTMLRPKFMIGKNGLTDKLASDIINRLKKDRLLKVRILSSYIEGKDKKAVAEELAVKTGSKIVQLIGFTVVLARK